MFGRKAKTTSVVNVTSKIVLTFTLFILLSNLASNYVNLRFNRSELLKLMNQLLIKDLKTMYSYCNNQYEIVYQRPRRGLLVESSCLDRRSLSAVAYFLQLRGRKAGVAENLLLGLAGF